MPASTERELAALGHNGKTFPVESQTGILSPFAQTYKPNHVNALLLPLRPDQPLFSIPGSFPVEYVTH